MRWLFAAAALSCTAATASQPAEPLRPQAMAGAVVTRDGDGWTIDYVLDRDAPAWLFPHSAVTREGRRPWRPGNWRVEMPGVSLVRRGHRDVLRAASGNVPRQVRIRFTPVSIDLIAEYDPALLFTDGSVALWSGHFHLIPLESRDQADSLPLDLDRFTLAQGNNEVTFRDRAGPVLHIGQRFNSATLIQGKSYVLLGSLAPAPGEGIAMVLDPALPAWLRAELIRSTGATMTRFAEWLGPHAGGTPSLFVSWRGPTRGMTSMGGSALPGQIVMAFEGDTIVNESRAIRDGARVFVAHEAAHFWLGNTVRYGPIADMWITEGGANLLAQRLIAAVDPDYDPRSKLADMVRACAGLAARPVASAAERGENDAFYMCGATFGLAVEAATGRPFQDFVRRLIDANRADGMLTRAEWLDALDRAAGAKSPRREIEALLDRGTDNPGAALTALFVKAGLPHDVGADGIPVPR